MGKLNRKQKASIQAQAKTLHNSMSPAEQQAMKLVMDEAFKRCTKQFAGKRVAKELLDEAMANHICDVVAEREAAEAEEKRVMMARAQATVDQPVLETVGGEQELCDAVCAAADELVREFEQQPTVSMEAAQEETMQQPKTEVVALVADDEGVYWPTPAYVKGETAPIVSVAVQAEVVAHATEEGAEQSMVGKIYTAMLNKLRGVKTEAVDESTTPTQSQPESTEETSTMQTNDNLKNEAADTNDGAESQSFWADLKAKLKDYGNKIGTFFDNQCSESYARFNAHRAAGRKFRAWGSFVGAVALAVIVLAYVFGLAANFLFQFGVIGLVAYIAFVVGVRVFAAHPMISTFYNGIDATIETVKSWFTKAPKATDDFATA